MHKKILFLAFIEGGLVMLLETASPIVVSPVLGHSMIIWSIMLCLSIGSLAIGYFIGGWLTKKERSYTYLMNLFLINTLIIFVGWLLLFIQNYSLSEIVTPFFTSIIIVFLLIIPLILFGASTPIIISFLNQMKNSTSSIAGDVFSISTVGGIFFSLLTGFYLIDNFGVSRTILIAILICSLFPLLYFVKSKRWIKTSLITITMLVSMLFLFKKNTLTKTDNFQTIHFSEGITGQLIVADFEENKQKHRILLINRMGQTKINLENNYSDWSYINYLTSAASIYPTGSKTLVLGLGGGILPKQIKHYLGHDVDAVELDERIIELSDKYFNNLNTKINIVNDDARRYIKTTEKHYNFIVLDIFNGEIMPSHGLSKEAFEDIDNILKPGGLIAINFNGFINGKEGTAGRSLIKTLKSAGYKVSLFETGAGDQSEAERNMLYFAYKETINWNLATVNTMLEGKEYKIGQHLYDMSSINMKNSFLITDDYPIMEYINRYAANSWRKAYLEGYTKKFRKEHKLPLVL